MAYSELERKVLLRHHGSEVYARRCAVQMARVVDRLGVPIGDKLAACVEAPLLATMGRRYRVSPDHYTLVGQLAQARLRARYGLGEGATHA